MADQYGNRNPNSRQFGDHSSLTNEMIRDQNIHNTSTIITQNHQQFIQNRQQLETMRIAQQLHERQQLQQQPNATNSFYVNKFKQIRQKFGLHKHTLHRSFSHLANESSITPPNANMIPQLHPPTSNIFTNSFIRSINNPPTQLSTGPLVTAAHLSGPAALSAIPAPASRSVINTGRGTMTAATSSLNPVNIVSRTASRRSRLSNARRSRGSTNVSTSASTSTNVNANTNGNTTNVNTNTNANAQSGLPNAIIQAAQRITGISTNTTITSNGNRSNDISIQGDRSIPPNSRRRLSNDTIGNLSSIPQIQQQSQFMSDQTFLQYDQTFTQQRQQPSTQRNVQNTQNSNTDVNVNAPRRIPHTMNPNNRQFLPQQTPPQQQSAMQQRMAIGRKFQQQLRQSQRVNPNQPNNNTNNRNRHAQQQTQGQSSNDQSAQLTADERKELEEKVTFDGDKPFDESINLSPQELANIDTRSRHRQKHPSTKRLATIIDQENEIDDFELERQQQQHQRHDNRNRDSGPELMSMLQSTTNNRNDDHSKQKISNVENEDELLSDENPFEMTDEDNQNHNHNQKQNNNQNTISQNINSNDNIDASNENATTQVTFDQIPTVAGDLEYLKFFKKYKPIFDQWLSMRRNETDDHELGEFQQLFIDYYNGTHDDRSDMKDAIEDWEGHANRRIDEIKELQHHDKVNEITEANASIVKELRALHDLAIDGTIGHYERTLRLWANSDPKYQGIRRDNWKELQHQIRNLHIRNNDYQSWKKAQAVFRKQNQKRQKKFADIYYQYKPDYVFLEKSSKEKADKTILVKFHDELETYQKASDVDRTVIIARVHGLGHQLVKRVKAIRQQQCDQVYAQYHDKIQELRTFKSKHGNKLIVKFNLAMNKWRDSAIEKRGSIMNEILHLYDLIIDEIDKLKRKANNSDRSDEEDEEDDDDDDNDNENDNSNDQDHNMESDSKQSKGAKDGNTNNSGDESGDHEDNGNTGNENDQKQTKTANNNSTNCTTTSTATQFKFTTPLSQIYNASNSTNTSNHKPTINPDFDVTGDGYYNKATPSGTVTHQSSTTVTTQPTTTPFPPLPCKGKNTTANSTTERTKSSLYNEMYKHQFGSNYYTASGGHQVTPTRRAPIVQSKSDDENDEEDDDQDNDNVTTNSNARTTNVKSKKTKKSKTKTNGRSKRRKHSPTSNISSHTSSSVSGSAAPALSSLLASNASSAAMPTYVASALPSNPPPLPGLGHLSAPPGPGHVAPPGPGVGHLAPPAAGADPLATQMASLLNMMNAQSHQILLQQQQLQNLQNQYGHGAPETIEAQMTLNARIQLQQKQKEFHKQLQSRKIKSECKFVCDKPLQHKQAETVQEQLNALLWFYDALLFAETSEIGKYDTEYLIHLIAEQGFTGHLFKLYTDFTTENGKFKDFDVFGDWIFLYHKLKPELIQFLSGKIVNTPMKAKDPPATLLKQHKKWYDLMELAVVLSNGQLRQYVPTKDDEYVKSLYQSLPSNYKSKLKIWSMINDNARPHTWDGLLDVVYMAADMMEQDEDTYHPSKERKPTESKIIGKRIYALRQKRFRRYNRSNRRGRRRGYRGGYRNQGYRGQRGRGRGSRGNYSHRGSYSSRGIRGSRGSRRPRGYRGNRGNRGYRGQASRGRGYNSNQNERNYNSHSTTNNDSSTTKSTKSQDHPYIRPKRFRRLSVIELTKDILKNPDNHYRYTECDECGYPGHWGYACKLMDIKDKIRLTKRAKQSRSSSVNVAKQPKSEPKSPPSNNNNNKGKRQRRNKQKQQRQSNNNNSNSNSNSNDNSNNNNNTGMPSTYGTRNKPVINTIRSNLLSLPSDLDANDVASAIANISQPSQQQRTGRK